jgi:hypothetical protein
MLAKSNRDLEMAKKMFEDYLNSPVKNEDAPAFVAHTRLARLEAASGDVDGARRERAAALALAHSYRPALDLKF